MTKATLTPKQAAFIDEFACDMNATQAAIRAGYSAKTAKEQATRLLSNVHVAAAIKANRAARSIRTEITADRVLQGLAAIAFADPRKLFDANGALKPLDQIDDETRAALVIEVTQGTDADGNPTFTRKAKFADKLFALDRLARHLGLLVDKLKLVNDPENPLLILIQRINSRGSSIRPVIQGVVEEYDRAA